MKKLQILAAVLLSSFGLVAHAATDWSSQDYDLYTGDFNGDNKTDLLYVAKDPNKSSGIALSDGNGPNIAFQSWSSNYLGIPWGGNTYRPIVADFNGDGRADVFMQRSSPGDHYLLLAGSDGRLVAVSQGISNTHLGLTWSADQHKIAVGDFNGDGKADYFLQGAAPSIVNAVVLSDANGFLTSGATQSWNDGYLGFKWSAAGASIYVGDFNGDGKEDLLLQARPKLLTIKYKITIPIAKYPPNMNGVVLSQGGASPFQQAGVRAFSRNAFGADFSPVTGTIVVGDFNGDGRDDIIVQSYSSSRASFLLTGNASGAIFANGTALANNVTLSADTYRLLTGNFDGVGGAGLFLQAPSSTGVNAYTNTITGGTIATTVYNSSTVTGIVPATAVGVTPGAFAVGNDGSANYSIPIVVPPGVAGVQPELALTYSSQRGNGWLGIGWDISGMSQITRCRKTFAQDGVAEAVTLTRSDRFCLDGARLRKTSSNNYGDQNSTYQLELETFTRITAYGTAGNGPAYFIAEAKNGSKFEYGNTSDSRIESLNPNASTTPRTWALNKVTDRAGNVMTVSYMEDQGSFHPLEMLYTSNASANVTAAYKVKFIWETRPSADPLSGYFAGGLVKEAFRLNRIETQFNDPAAGGFRVVRKYQLAYYLSNSTGRSRLTSVQECEFGGTCLSPTIIGWQEGQSGFTPPAPYSPPASAASGVVKAGLVPIPMDINGDGRTDIAQADLADTESRTRIKFILANAAGGFGAPQDPGLVYSPIAPLDYNGDGKDDLLVYDATSPSILQSTGTGFTAIRISNPTSLNGAKVGDVDGDGRPDLIVADGVSNQGSVLFNGPSGFGAPVNMFTIAPITGSLPLTPPIIGVGDFNADGRTDLLVRTNVDGGSQLLLSRGASLPYTVTTLTLPDKSSPIVADFNGDGIDDVTYTCNSSRCLRFGGAGAPGDKGLGPEVNTNQPGVTLNTAAIVFAIDWDSDGRADILQGNPDYFAGGTLKLLRATGESFGPPSEVGIPLIPYLTPIFGINPYEALLGDYNGDGLVDLATRIATLRDSVTTVTNDISFHRPGIADLVTSIADGFGNATNVMYAPLTDSGVYTKGAGAVFPQADIQKPMQVVKQYAQTDGTGGSFTVSATYSGARLDQSGRGFLGFASRRLVDSRDNIYVSDYYRQDFPFTGSVSQHDELQSNSTLISRVINTYKSTVLDTTTNNQRYLVVPDQTTTRRYEVGGIKNGVQISEQATRVVYDTYGNPTDVTVTATDKDSGSPFFNQVWQTRAVGVYTTDTSAWCSLPNQLTVTNTLPDGTAQSRVVGFTVNSQFCRPTQQIIEPSSTTLKVTSNFGFDSCGNLNSVGVVGKKPDGTDMATRTSSLNFGTRCVFPETVTNALSQATTASYRYDIGEQSSVTDPNGLTTSSIHDNFGRLLREVRPDGTATDKYYSLCTNANNYCGVSDLRFQVQNVERDTANAAISTAVSFFDSLGRVRISQTQRATGALSYVSTTYDSLGRPVTRSRPYSSGSNGFTRNTYDLLDRLTKVEFVRPDSSIDRTSTITYAGGTVTSTSPKLQTKQQVFDLAGTLRKVTDASGTTQYTYDPFNNLKSLVDPLGNTTTAVFNIRGLRTSLTDPDRGGSSFIFNSLGELLSRTNAKNQTTSFTYDSLSRVRTRTEPEGTTTFIFDTAARGIGQLASVSSPGGYAEAFLYDSAGRTQQVTYTEDTTYQVNYDYNNQGLLDAVTYPTSTSNYRLKLKYGYAYGSLVQVKDFNAPGTVFWTLNATDDADNPIEETLGNGVRQISVYNPLTGELNGRQSGSGGSTTNLQNLAYQWDLTGNLKQRQDGLQSLTEAFSYDSLDRLTGSTLTTPTGSTSNLTVGFDTLGNITSKSDVGTYNYTTAQTGCSYYAHAQPHAVRKAGNNVYCYDQNGNMTKRAGDTITYASYDLPIQINQGTNSSQFSYGADRQRWRQVATYSGSTETTIYVGGLLDKVTRGGVTEYRHYIATGSDASAIYTRKSDGTTVTSYVTGDHLGSTSVITDHTGAVKVRESFTAYGARRGSNWSGAPSASDLSQIAGTTRDGFTGHEHLDNLNLIHMNGRVYDPTLGRFLSADPFVQDPTNSQSLNRYSYVFNSPLSYTDPSGFFCTSPDNCDSAPPSNPFNPPGDPTFRPDTPSFPGVFLQTIGLLNLIKPNNAANANVRGLPKNGSDFMQGTQTGNGRRSFFGITVGDVLDVVPVVGTVKGIYEAYKDPSFVNVVSAVVSVVPGGGAVAGKVIKVAGKIVRGRKVEKAGSAVVREVDEAGAAVVKKTCCFVAGTLVATEEGLRPIEEIEVGDRVLSRDDVSGETDFKEVTELIRRHEREIWELVFEVADESGEVTRAVFETTDDHPWRLDAGVWARTDELQAGMRVLRAEGTAATIVSVRKTDRVAPTFNLEVAEFHTYFVGDAWVWVHNECDLGASRVAEFLRSLGRNVERNPLEGAAGAGRQGDLIVDGIKTEVKTVQPGATSNTIRNTVNDSIRREGQAREIIIDARGSGLSKAEAERGISRVRSPSVSRGKLDRITILGDDFFVGSAVP